MADVKRKAKWIARATVAMNNHDAYPFKDSEAARWKSDEAAAERRKAKRLRATSSVKKTRKVRFERPAALGGHILEQTEPGKRKGWRCTICKRTSASRPKLA